MRPQKSARLCQTLPYFPAICASASCHLRLALLPFAQEAGLKDALDEMQVHQTMLMPSDDAFEAFFAELRSNATELAQYKDMLQDIILYHVINGTKSTYDFVQGTVRAALLLERTARSTSNVVHGPASNQQLGARFVPQTDEA
eukprot:357234-Chlamydomonas_euryale.AAC.2